MLFLKKQKCDFLLVCLGNPGREYEKTRHNAGFLFAEWLQKNKNVKIKRAKFGALYGRLSLAGRSGIVMMPQTYMNLSGTAVKSYAASYGVRPSDVIVIADDINFDVGQMRIKRKGSSGGQKGVGNIIEMLGTEEFPRIKIGVGDKNSGQDLKDYVLSDFTKKELDVLDGLFPDVYDAAELTANGSIELAMQKYN